MKKVELPQKLVEEMHTHFKDCDRTYYVDAIEKEVPELFKNRLEVGKWYKNPGYGEAIYCVTSIGDGRFKAYGFDYHGAWNDSCDFGDVSDGDRQEATYEEVETALIEEAKNRGLIKGVNVASVFQDYKDVLLNEYSFRYGTQLWSRGCNFGIMLMDEDGTWATRIEKVKELTIEEIQDKLGYKIKIVE